MKYFGICSIFVSLAVISLGSGQNLQNFLQKEEGNEALLISPIDGKTGEEAAIIFIIGAYCSQ